MRKIVVTNSLTLDSVMRAPGRPDEDQRGGVEHGGVAMAYKDPVMMQAMGEGMGQGADLLFGRRTYEDFFCRVAWAQEQPIHGGARQLSEVRGLQDAEGAAAEAECLREPFLRDRVWARVGNLSTRKRIDQ